MSAYAVNDLYPALQGEGCLTGTPMALLRLQGCDMHCPWCDTKETWQRREEQRVETLEQARADKPAWAWIETHEIACRIRDYWPALRWVMVTGGEPAQQDLRPLLLALHAVGLKVALETSGAYDLPTLAFEPAFDWVCVSPKRVPPLPTVVGLADEIKQVVARLADIGQLETLLAKGWHAKDCTICLQPVSQNTKATELCIQMCLRKGWRLSLQTHKLLALP